MPSCIIKSCKNNTLSNKKQCGITFHRFPEEFDWKQKWIEVVQTSRKEESWLPSKFSVICSTHFADNDLYLTKGGLRRVKKNAIPTKILIEQMNDSVTDDDGNRELSLPSKSNTEPQNQNVGQHLDANRSSPEQSVEDSDLESLFDTPVQSKMRKKLRRHVKLVATNNKKIKLLQQRVRRLEKRNKSLKNVIIKLKEANLVDRDVYNKPTENVVAADIFNNMYKRKKSNKKIKYSPAIKKFCLTLNHYSPKAYDLVRSSFEPCLPHPKTILKWCSVKHPVVSLLVNNKI